MRQIERDLPLRHFGLVSTTDVDEMTEAIRPIFGDLKLDVPEGARGFRATTNCAFLQHSAVYYGHYADQLRVAIPSATFVAQGMTLAGTGIYEHGAASDELQNESLPAPVLESSRANIAFSGGHRHLAFCMRPKSLQQKFNAVIGVEADRELQLKSCIPPPLEYLRRFQRLFAVLVNELDRTDGPPPSLLLRELEQTLMVAFIVINKHSLGYPLSSVAADVAPWQVRRVEEYVAAHWDQPIDIEAIAKTVEASVRSIQHAFRKSRGYTPTEFLRRVRLSHARNMLLQPERRASVTDVAYACGFGNLGHFSRCYFEEYGELPSQTLNRAKSRN